MLLNGANKETKQQQKVETKDVSLHTLGIKLIFRRVQSIGGFMVLIVPSSSSSACLAY